MKATNNKDLSTIMRDEEIPKLLVLYSLPVFFSYLCNSLDNIVCRAFVGNGAAGYLGIAGISVAFPITLVQISFAFLLGMGGSTLAASRVGEGDKKAANRAMNLSMQMLIIVGLIITLFGNLFLDQLMVLFGASEDVLPFAKGYARILMSGCIFQLISVGMTNYMRVEGRTGLAMLAVILGPIVNFVLCFVLIKVLDLGVTGAALATVTGQFCNTCVVLVHYIRSKDFFHFDKSILVPDLKLAGQIAYLGLSAFALQICSGTVSVFLNRMARSYGGDIAVSGMGVVTTLQTFIVTVTSATNMGSQSLISYNYGARSYSRIRELIRKAVIANVIIVGLEYLVLKLFTVPIATIFCKGNADVVTFSSHALVIYLMMTPLTPIQIQGAGFFQAVKKPIIAMILSLTRQGLLLMPLLLILPKFFDIEGVFYAGPIADLLSVLITLPVLLSFLKKLRNAKDGEPLAK